MPDSFTCRECGRTTHRDNYQWRDEPLYSNLEKLKLCEECYRNGNQRHRTRNRPHNILHQGQTRTDPETTTDPATTQSQKKKLNQTPTKTETEASHHQRKTQNQGNPASHEPPKNPEPL